MPNVRLHSAQVGSGGVSFPVHAPQQGGPQEQEAGAHGHGETHPHPSKAPACKHSQSIAHGQANDEKRSKTRGSREAVSADTSEAA